MDERNEDQKNYKHCITHIIHILTSLNQQLEKWTDTEASIYSFVIHIVHAYTPLNLTGALKFVLDPEDYDQGTHKVVVTATNLLGETEVYEFSFGKNSHISRPAILYKFNYSKESSGLTPIRFHTGYFGGGRSLWDIATASCMSMRLYKFCFEYETIQVLWGG